MSTLIAKAKELEDQASALLREAGELRKQAKLELIESMKRQAAESGLTISELLGPKSGKSGAAVSTGKCYVNPNDPELRWLGRGKRPTWLRDLLASGTSLESLSG